MLLSFKREIQYLAIADCCVLLISHDDSINDFNLLFIVDCCANCFEASTDLITKNKKAPHLHIKGGVLLLCLCSSISAEKFKILLLLIIMFC